MNEAAFQGWVTDVATRFGWRWWHVPAPMRFIPGQNRPIPAPEGAGLPDLVLIHTDPARMILAELKGDGGSLTPGQKEFLTLASCVVDAVSAMQGDTPFGGIPLGVYAWKPGDEAIIETILRSRHLT